MPFTVPWKAIEGVVVDTNILLYAVNPTCPEYAAARAAVEGLRNGESSWFLTWSVIYEFLRASTHREVLEPPMSLLGAIAFVRLLLDAPSVTILRETEAHLATLDELAGQTPGISGNGVHDAHIVSLMREHGVTTILTADRGFRRFKDLRVIDPVHA